MLRKESSLVLRGAEAVAAHTATYSNWFPLVRPALVNGTAGAIVATGKRVLAVMAFTVTDGKMIQVDALMDPERLAGLSLTLPGA